MTEMGWAIKQASRRRETENQRRAKASARQRRALAEAEARETQRLRDQQRLLRAAFYQRHPELDAA